MTTDRRGATRARSLLASASRASLASGNFFPEGRFMPRVCYAPDPPPPAPPSGDNPPPAPPAPPSPGPDGRPPASTPPPAAAYRPEGLPDHLVGATERETIDKLFKAFDGARRAQGDRGAVPDKPEAYAFEPTDKLKPYVGNFDKDPVYAQVRSIAHQAGLTDKQFQAFLPKVLEHFVDAELVGAPVDAKAMLRSLAPASAANLKSEEQEQAAARRVSANTAWVDGAKQQGTLPSDVAEFFAAALASDPRAHKAVEWLRGNDAEPRPALPGGGPAGGVTDEAVQARLNDPKNDPRSPQFDRAFAAETDRLSKQAWG